MFCSLTEIWVEQNNCILVWSHLVQIVEKQEEQLVGS